MALREQDVLDMLRLVAEASAQSAAGPARCQRLLRGLTAMAPARMALAATLSFSAPSRELHVLSATACGLDGATLLQTDASGGAPRDLVLRAIAPMLNRLQAALADAWAFQGPAFTSHLRRQMGFGHYACSSRRQAADGQLHLLAVCRAGAEPPFTEREDQLVHLLHEQVEALSASTAAPAALLANLPPYLQRLVPELLAGGGEKQIAARLGFTFNTTHQYIKAIYRRVGVTSRAEFMARCMQASGGGRGGANEKVTGAANAPATALPAPAPSMPAFFVGRNTVPITMARPVAAEKETQ